MSDDYCERCGIDLDTDGQLCSYCEDDYNNDPYDCYYGYEGENDEEYDDYREEEDDPYTYVDYYDDQSDEEEYYYDDYREEEEDDFREKRYYGFFRCPSCRKVWESSHVYCKKQNGLLTTLYGQDCRNCRTGCFPFKVEPLRCSLCGATDCRCDRTRHSDLTKPHRSDLCHRCRSGRPCQRA